MDKSKQSLKRRLLRQLFFMNVSFDGGGAFLWRFRILSVQCLKLALQKRHYKMSMIG